MIKIYWYAGGLVFFVIFMTVLSHLPQPIDSNDKSEKPLDYFVKKPVKSNWKSALMEVPDYAPPRKPIKDVVASSSMITIADGKLLGIINTAQPSVVILVPNEIKPKRIAINDGWLNDWKLETINEVEVVWRNSQTLETHIQVMFQ